MTFRWCLTLTYALLLGITLLLVGALNYAALRHALYTTFDKSLRSAAQRLVMQENQLDYTPPARVGAVLDPLSRQQPTRLTVCETGLEPFPHRLRRRARPFSGGC